MDNMQDILKGYYAAGGKDLFTVVESAEQLAEVADTGMYNPSKSEPVYQKMQTFLAFAVKQGFTDIKHIQDPNTFDMLAGRLAQSGVDLTEQLDEDKRSESEKIRQRHIKSGHNKKVKQCLHDEGMKVIEQWRDQLIAKFPRIAKRRIPLGKGPFSSLIPDVLSPISLVKDVVSDGNLKRVAKWWGGQNGINSAGIDSMKTRMFYRTEVEQASEEILLKLLPQIDIEKIKAVYKDPSILDENFPIPPTNDKLLQKIRDWQIRGTSTGDSELFSMCHNYLMDPDKPMAGKLEVIQKIDLAMDMDSSKTPTEKDVYDYIRNSGVDMPFNPRVD